MALLTFGALPLALRGVLLTYVVLHALALLVLGSQGAQLLTTLNTTRGSSTSRPLFPAGLSGLLLGSIALPAVAALLYVTIVDATGADELSDAVLLAIFVAAAVLGTATLGRISLLASLSSAFLGALSIVLLFAASASLSPGSTTALAALVVLLVLFVALAVVHFVPPQAAPYVRAATSASIGAWLFVVACDVFVQAGAMDLVRVLVFSNDDAQVDLMASTPSGKGLIAGWWLIAATSLAGQTLWIAKAGVLGGDEKAWDDYLASYLTSHPDKRGTYTPHPTLSQRLGDLFSGKKKKQHQQHRAVRPWDDDDDEADEEGAMTWDDADPEKGRAAYDSDEEDVYEAELRDGTLTRLPSRRRSRRHHHHPHHHPERHLRHVEDDVYRVPMYTLPYSTSPAPSPPHSPIAVPLSPTSISRKSVASKRSSSTKPAKWDDISSSSDEESGTPIAAPSIAATSVSSGGSTSKAARPAVSASTSARSVALSSSAASQSSSRTEQAQKAGELVAGAPAEMVARAASSSHGSASSTGPVVPATPSLINALERVAMAQRQARHGTAASAEQGPPPTPSESKIKSRIAEWEARAASRRETR